MCGTFLSSITEEDVRKVKEGFERLRKADAETQREFYTRVGLYDKDGNIAEEYRDLFEETPAVICQKSGDHRRVPRPQQGTRRRRQNRRG